MNSLKITTVFDNTSLDPKTRPEWGFAAVIELPEETILFDTGNNGEILEGNLKILGFMETQFSKIIISHMHWDHTGGLARMIELNPDAVLYVPSTAERAQVEKFKSEQVVLVREAQQITPRLYSLGEMPARANEQSLAIKTADGLVIVTGCAHPGIVEIVKAARVQFPDEKIRLVMGGFHLGQHSAEQVQDIATTLKSLNVEQVSPTHCTGQSAILVFEKEYGEKFIKPGVGLRLEFSLAEK